MWKEAAKLRAVSQDISHIMWKNFDLVKDMPFNREVHSFIGHLNQRIRQLERVDCDE
jgi:hypothetical protein